MKQYANIEPNMSNMKLINDVYTTLSSICDVVWKLPHCSNDKTWMTVAQTNRTKLLESIKMISIKTQAPFLLTKHIHYFNEKIKTSIKKQNAELIEELDDLLKCINAQYNIDQQFITYQQCIIAMLSSQTSSLRGSADVSLKKVIAKINEEIITPFEDLENVLFKEDERDHSEEIMSIFKLHHDKMRKALNEISSISCISTKGNDDQIKLLGNKIKELQK